MRLIALTFVALLASCSSGGSNNTDTSNNTSTSNGNSQNSTSQSNISSSSQANIAQQTIDANYPKVAYSDAASLKDFAEFPIGVELEAGSEGSSIFTLTEQQDIVTKHFSEIVPGNIMKMPYLHPEEDQFFFDDADAFVDFALANNLRVHGHTLVWYFHDGLPEVPDWMLNYTGDWNAMIDNHITQIVSHFKGRVHSWDVVNEAVKATAAQVNIASEANYENSPFFQAMGKEFIENAFISADQADPDAILYYNDWALSHKDARLDFTLNMVNDFIERAIPIDGIGFQMHTWLDWPSKTTIQTAFEKAAATGLMIKITELDIRKSQEPSTSSNTHSPELQLRYKDRYKEIVEAYLNAVPPEQRGGISVWGLADKNSWIRAVYSPSEWPVLFDDDYTVKPAFYGVIEALTAQ